MRGRSGGAGDEAAIASIDGQGHQDAEAARQRAHPAQSDAQHPHMKNQYFGDVNDYRKYGLLRALVASGDLRLLVAWMLTPDDGSSDGRHRSHLAANSPMARHDPELHAGLLELLRDGVRPEVALIERSTLLPAATYFSDIVPDEKAAREAWRCRLFSAADRADLVFLDPDNGIEIASKPVGRKGSSKYVTWAEIGELGRRGKSLLIYQHFPRKPRDVFACDLAARLRTWTGSSSVKAFGTAQVLFLLAVHANHEHHLGRFSTRAIEMWQDQIHTIRTAREPSQEALPSATDD